MYIYIKKIASVKTIFSTAFDLFLLMQELFDKHVYINKMHIRISALLVSPYASSSLLV